MAVITGAASGIGRATAILFAREGARLVLADWHEKGLRETLDIVLERGWRGGRTDERMWPLRKRSGN